MHKILMVEDDAAIRSALGRHLSRWGYQVQAAENFQNVLEQFEEFQPHLVLLDISLPFFDGYYWCRQIRRASQTPIIFLSSAGDDMNLVMAIQLGADDFIPKPFRIEVVLAKIQALLRRAQMGNSLTQPFKKTAFPKSNYACASNAAKAALAFAKPSAWIASACTRTFTVIVPSSDTRIAPLLTAFWMFALVASSAIPM